MHELISSFFKNKIAHEDKEPITSIFNRKWEKERFKFLDRHEEIQNKCKKDINLFEKSQIAQIQPIATEYRFSNLIDKDLRIIGRIDLVGKANNDIQIWDFKLDESEISLTKEEHKIYFQLIFYYYGLGDIFGSLPRELGYYFLSTGNTISIKIYPELIERGYQEIKNTLDEMNKTETYFPRDNNLCSSCGFSYICPKFENQKKEN